MNTIKSIISSFALCICTGAIAFSATSAIDRKAVVQRHNICIEHSLKQSPAQVGNGRFAFGMDITGLQTFIPFNTLSDWGWHSFPLEDGVSVDDYRLFEFETAGVKRLYYNRTNATEKQKAATDYLMMNPHRVHLGRIGFILKKRDGSQALEQDLSDCKQYTELWTGEVHSSFTLEGERVTLTTICHPDKDEILISLHSSLCSQDRLSIFVEFPYADSKSFNKFVGDYGADNLHYSEIVSRSKSEAMLRHKMDSLDYFLKTAWTGDVNVESRGVHRYEFTPSSDTLECAFLFTQDGREEIEGYSESLDKNIASWEKYWMQGAAIDLSESTDPRWKELERRVVLSQYLMRINESGLYPPQEAGLVNNGWYGRYHFEMIWWHAAHYFFWDRPQYCDKYLQVYKEFMPVAMERASLEGRIGARWPKCTANYNREWPGSAHAFLIWQQPHPIYFAEMDYRLHPRQSTLEKWADVVIATADYMADYVVWDEAKRKYIIASPVLPVSENTDPLTTVNPAFELAYFRFSLSLALKWADRLDLSPSRTAKWRKVLRKLDLPPIKDGYYVTDETMENMWEEHNYEHPAITGMYGWLPGDGINKRVFRKTFYRVLDKWKMDKIWGWDFPMLAMAAARLGDPSKAIDLLTTTEHKFAFDPHGYADTWPFPYFPANGGLLTAIAMMCEGWDGSHGNAPGFPKDGSWTVKYEGFYKMP